MVPGRRQLDALLATHEQRRADFMLEPRDAPAQGGLNDVKVGGRAVEPAQRRDLHENFEILQIHRVRDTVMSRSLRLHRPELSLIGISEVSK